MRDAGSLLIARCQHPADGPAFCRVRDEFLALYGVREAWPQREKARLLAGLNLSRLARSRGDQESGR